jgi:hypothetical protein
MRRIATVSAKQITQKLAESRLFEHVVAKRIVRVPQPRYLLAIKGTHAVCNQTAWRGKPGSLSFWLLFIGDARKSNQPPVCHRHL